MKSFLVEFELFGVEKVRQRSYNSKEKKTQERKPNLSKVLNWMELNIDIDTYMHLHFDVPQ